MKLTQPLEKVYCNDGQSASQAQRLAQEIAFAPVVFQVSRLMLKFGILEFLSGRRDGASQEEIAGHAGLSGYAVQVLLEASLSIGTVKTRDDRFMLSKAGWFLLNDDIVRANLDFNHDVNYLGLYHLEEALTEGRPAGLKVFGDWSTIYEALSGLPEHVQKSWFGFDHFYSDGSFAQALEIVFSGERKVRRMLDVGGNTGRWAMRCVSHDKDVEVTVMDLPQQIEMMRRNIEGREGSERIHGYGCDLLDGNVSFPSPPYDIIWMSQFLDCFSEEEVTGICRRAAESMDENSRLYIMETFWDRQKYETAAYCLTLTSPYFTALANGNSKMYHSDDMVRCVEDAGLEVERTVDGLGLGHSIMICRKRNHSILELIPHRTPIVMVDEFLGIMDNVSRTRLTVRNDNMFVESGILSECGLIEHIAQSAAARAGYESRTRNMSVPIGYIGSVNDFRMSAHPETGDEINTFVEVVHEVFNVTLIQARCFVDGRETASCRMKIFLEQAQA